MELALDPVGRINGLEVDIGSRVPDSPVRVTLTVVGVPDILPDMTTVFELVGEVPLLLNTTEVGLTRLVREVVSRWNPEVELDNAKVELDDTETGSDDTKVGLDDT